MHKMNKILFISIITIVLSVFTITAYADAYCYNVPIFAQKDEDTCWAASDAMVAAHYHEDVVDREVSIYTHVFGGPVKATSLSQIISGLKYALTGAVTQPSKVQEMDSTLSQTAFKYQFNNNAPVLARININNLSLHAVVFTYYIDGSTDSGDEVGYNDPWDGSGHIINYATLVTHNWSSQGGCIILQ